VLTLEVQLAGTSDWEPVAKVRLVEPVVVDQRRLRFNPYLDGRGIHPRGFVHWLRLGAYAGSQRIRAVVPQTSQSA
jgi:hypothetical protein